MPEIPIRRLRAELASAVRRAEAGDVSIVTVGGRPVAQLAPIGTGGAAPATVADLVARGAVIAPRRLDPYRPGDPVSVWRAARLDRVLDDVR